MIHTVTYRSNGKDGFAIIGESNNVQKIYYITDNGTPSDAKEISSLNEYINYLPTALGTFPIDGPGIFNDSIMAWIEHDPIVLTEWGQGAPYDAYTPICYNGDWGEVPHGPHHYHVGCVAVAIGQLLAQQDYVYTVANGRVFNLGSFAQTPAPSPDQEDNLALILKDLSDKLDMKYIKCYLSGCYPDDWERVLTELGFTYSIKKELNNKEFRNFIISGTPILVNGYEGFAKGGHMWILDGIYGPIYEPYYHCNWGWGGKCNGWLLGTPLIAIGAITNKDGSLTDADYSYNPSYYLCTKQ